VQQQRLYHILFVSFYANQMLYNLSKYVDNNIDQNISNAANFLQA